MYLNQDEQSEREKREDIAEWEDYLLTGNAISQEHMDAWLSQLAQGERVRWQEQTEPWVDPAGAWSDLPEAMLEDLDRMRHETPPTPPIQEL